MILIMLALLTFGCGASLTRLVTRDSLLAGFRDRWTDHFAYRRDRILIEIDSRYQIRDKAMENYATLLTRSGQPTRKEELNREQIQSSLIMDIDQRASEELPLPFWMVGPARTTRRPWGRYQARLAWAADWSKFISCPFCVGFWVYLVVVAWTWWRGLDAATSTAELLHPRLSADFVVLGVVVGGALAARWVYALLAGLLDR